MSRKFLKKNQKNKILGYMRPSIRQNIFLDQLEEEYNNIQQNKCESSTTSDKPSNTIDTDLNDELFSLKNDFKNLKKENSKLLAARQ